MSKNFKRLLLWMLMIVLLVVFTGVNTYLALHEQVDTFERRQNFHVRQISAEVILDDESACVFAC